jgi:nucleoside 2-deoxyribosyltransferase
MRKRPTNRKLLYFAGPLFSEAERQFSQRLTDKIESLGYRVFLPQRSGVERGGTPYDAMPPDERRRIRSALHFRKELV